MMFSILVISVVVLKMNLRAGAQVSRNILFAKVPLFSK
jgi:hypothetical protein